MMAPGLRLIRAMTYALLPKTEREIIVGDLDEMFDARARRYGRRRAVRLYVRDAIASVASRRMPGRRRSSRRRSGRRKAAWGGIPGDLRSAYRTLRREPGFVALTVLTLALGVGSTTAVFGMVNELLLRPLPGVDRTLESGYLRLYSRARADDLQSHGLAQDDFEALRADATLLAGLASYGFTELTLTREGRRPAAVMANTIYGDFFEVLGVKASEGRLLTASETELHADPLVAVISERLRASLFGESERAAGSTIVLNGRSVMIVGVAGDGFAGSDRGSAIDLWIPHGAIAPLLGFDPEVIRSPQSTMHDDLIARVRPGFNTDAAQAQIATVLAHIATTRTQDREYIADLRPVLHSGLHLPPQWRSRTHGALRVLGGVVLMVLLIACANVANLLLVRNVKRRGTLATRRALGASSGRVAREQLVESLGLALLGVFAGLATAWLITLPFLGERLFFVPEYTGFAVDARVLLFAGTAAVFTTLLFGALPATLAGRFDLAGAIRSSNVRETGRVAGLRAALSAAQIALSVALVIGGLLLIRTVRNVYAVDTGFDIDNVLWLSVDRPNGLDEQATEALQRDLLARIGGLPGVGAVALDVYGPHGPLIVGRIALPGADRANGVRAVMFPVTPGWFELFRVEMARGRTFEAADWRRGSPGKAIVTASLARRMFGTEAVVGRRVVGGFGNDAEFEVVGVTADLRAANTPDQAQEAVFFTYDAAPEFPMMLIVRTHGPDAALERDIRMAVEGLLPEEPVPDALPLTRRIDAIHAERRLFSRLLAILSTFALLLAAVGLYGVIAFNVAGRRREFGIRLALGARSTGIAALVARHAATVTIFGLSLGLIAAYGLSKVLESRLFGVAPTDAATYVVAALLFAIVALVSCWTPVLTAIRVDPAVTLREP